MHYALVNQLNSYTYDEEYKPKLDIFFEEKVVSESWFDWIKSRIFRK